MQSVFAFYYDQAMDLLAEARQHPRVVAFRGHYPTLGVAPRRGAAVVVTATALMASMAPAASAAPAGEPAGGNARVAGARPVQESTYGGSPAGVEFTAPRMEGVSGSRPSGDSVPAAASDPEPVRNAPPPDDPGGDAGGDAGDPAEPESRWPDGLDKVPPYAREYRRDETGGSVELLFWKHEGTETTIVQRRADGSVLETTGESTSDGVPFKVKGGAGTLQGGADLTVSWKDEKSESLLFDNERQYREYSAGVAAERRRILAEEMAEPLNGGDEASAARDARRRLDRVDERADAFAEGVRLRQGIDKITTDGSGRSEEGGVGGEFPVASGKVGGHHQEGTSVTVNDKGTADPADDVRIETDTAAGGPDIGGAVGLKVKDVGPEGELTYDSTGTRSGQVIYEGGRPARYVQLKEQDWKGGWSAGASARGAGGSGGQDLAGEDGVTNIRTEVDLNKPGAEEALRRWQEAQRAYDDAEFTYRSAGGPQAGEAADPQGFAAAKAELDEAAQEWGRYLDEGVRTRAEYGRDTEEFTPGLEVCAGPCVGAEGGESGETRRLLGTYYRDPETGEWKPYTHGMPNDHDGDGVADDDYGHTNNYGPGSGNPNGDTSGGDLDDAPVLEPGDPLPDFPDMPGPAVGDTDGDGIEDGWAPDEDGDGVRDNRPPNNVGPGSGNPGGDPSGGDLDDARPWIADPGDPDVDGDGWDDDWPSRNVGPGSGNPGQDASGGDLDDAQPWAADPADPDHDHDGWDDNWSSPNVGPGSGNPDGDASGGDLDDAPGFENMPDSDPVSGGPTGSDGDQSHVWEGPDAAGPGDPDADGDDVDDDAVPENVGPGSGNPDGDPSGGDLDDERPDVPDEGAADVENDADGDNVDDDAVPENVGPGSGNPDGDPSGGDLDDRNPDVPDGESEPENDSDGDDVDDDAPPENVGPGSGNPDGDPSGGDLDDERPDVPDASAADVENDADGDNVDDDAPPENVGPGSGNPDGDASGGDLDDQNPDVSDGESEPEPEPAPAEPEAEEAPAPPENDADGDNVDDDAPPENVGPGSGNPDGDSSGGDLDDANPDVPDAGAAEPAPAPAPAPPPPGPTPV